MAEVSSSSSRPETAQGSQDVLTRKTRERPLLHFLGRVTAGTLIFCGGLAVTGNYLIDRAADSGTEVLSGGLIPTVADLRDTVDKNGIRLREGFDETNENLSPLTEILPEGEEAAAETTTTTIAPTTTTVVPPTTALGQEIQHPFDGWFIAGIGPDQP